MGEIESARALEEKKRFSSTDFSWKLYLQGEGWSKAEEGDPGWRVDSEGKVHGMTCFLEKRVLERGAVASGGYNCTAPGGKISMKKKKV